MHGLKT